MNDPEKLVLKVMNVPTDMWVSAPIVAKQFLKNYPEKLGFSQGVVYVGETGGSFYVYRTKTSIVVRGTK